MTKLSGAGIAAPLLGLGLLAWVIVAMGGATGGVRITDPAVLGSQPASAFVRDLYLAPHGEFWRGQAAQRRLVDVGEAVCNRTVANVAGAFPAASSGEDAEFLTITRRHLCPVMARGKVPGYDGPP